MHINKFDLITSLWSLMSVILVMFFSSGLISSILKQKIFTIDNYDEMINSNMTLISGNDTYLYHSIKWVHSFNESKTLELKSKVHFEDDCSVCYLIF